MPVDLVGAITNTTEVVQMVVDTAVTMTDLLMTPPIVFVVGISVASALFLHGAFFLPPAHTLSLSPFLLSRWKKPKGLL